MQSNFQIQNLLLQWHKHQGVCSIEQIRTACSNLLRSFDLETEHSLFKVFFPLLRKGFIEFCGNGKYQISYPVILYYQKEQIAVGINLLEVQKELLKEVGKVNEDEFGICRLIIVKKHIQDFCIKNNCNYSEPIISDILSNFPKISDVVGKFDKSSISSSGEYFNVLKHRWVRNNNQSAGVFRLSEDSYKYYLRTQNHGDLQIPDSKINPEGRPLAESYQAVVEKHDFLFYNKKDKVLTVKDINIPILIERVLRMASLPFNEGIKEEHRKTIYENISISVVKQLNRIFGTKVKTEA